MSGEKPRKEQMDQVMAMRAKLFSSKINELVSVYGSVRAVGRALNIDHVYLHRLMSGEKKNPSKAVLRKLGFE